MNVLHKISVVSLLLCTLVGWQSCLDEIDFKRPDTIENGIAIQGKLVKADSSFVTVSVRRVFDFASDPSLVNARRVVLLNEKGDALELESKTIGIYNAAITANDPNFQLDYGNAFRIKVDLFDGRSYESTLETLHPVSEPTDLTASIVQREQVDATGEIALFDAIGFTYSTSLRTSEQTKPRLLLELEATYEQTDSPEAYGNRPCFPLRVSGAENKTCYVSISPQTNHIVVDATEIEQDELNDFLLYTTTFSYLFAEGYYLTVYQQSLSPTAYDYWEQVSQVMNQEGGLFEAPSGKIKTNLQRTDEAVNDVYGYFYVTEQKVRRVYVSPELANNPDSRCPAPLSEGGIAPTDCCDCSTQENTVTQRPEWWVE